MNNADVIKVRKEIQLLISGELSPSDVIGSDNLTTERWLKGSTDIQFASVFLYTKAKDLLYRSGDSKTNAAVVLADKEGKLFTSRQEALVSDVFATAKTLTQGRLYLDVAYRVEIEPLFDGFVIALY